MADTQLGIFIKSLFDPTGTTSASQGLNAVSQSSSQAAVEQAAMSARSAELATKLKELGSQVASGAKSVDDATKEYDEFERSLAKLSPTAEEAAPNVQKTGTATDFLKGKVTELVAGGALLALGKQLLDYGKMSIQTASNVEEMQSKFNIVFGETADTVEAELGRFADAANRSKTDLMGLASAFQDTFVPLGYSREEAAKMSVQLTQLAEDLASFNNTDTATVAADLQSAMVGNTETLKKYGVVAQETQIKEYALSHALWDGTGAMDAQAKTAAIMGIAFASTTDAQGDAIRTSESYANTVRGMDAASKDLQVTIGNALLPTATEMVSITTQLIKNFNAFATVATGQATPAVEDLTKQNKALAESSPVEAIQKLGKALEASNEPMEKLKYSTNSVDGVMALLEVSAVKLSGVQGELRQSAMELLAEQIKFSETSSTIPEKEVDVMRSLKATYGAAVELRGGMIYLNDQMITDISTMRAFAEQYQRGANFLHAFHLGETAVANAIAAATEELAYQEAHTQSLGDAMELTTVRLDEENKKLSESERAKLAAANADAEYAAGKQAVLEAHQKAAESLQEQARLHDQAAEAAKREAAALAEAAAVASGKYFDAAMQAEVGQGLLNQSIEDLGTHLVTVGGRTQQQSQDLGELQDQYDRAAATIHDYEVGLKGLGMSEDERAQKIQEQRDLMGQLTGAMQPLIDITGELTSVNNTASFNQDAVNQKIYDAAVAAGADAEALAVLRVGLGLTTEQQAVAGLAAADVEQAIYDLGEEYKAGKITMGEYVEKSQELTDGAFAQAQANYDAAAATDATKTAADRAAEGIGKLTSAAQTYANTLAQMPTDIEISVHTNYTESGQPPTVPGGVGSPDQHKPGATSGNDAGLAGGGSVLDSMLYKVGENNAPELFATSDGLFMIPGDQGRIFGHAESQAMLAGGMSGGVYFAPGSIVVHGAQGQDVNELADILYTRINSKMMKDLRVATANGR